jgi:hypothetical protein
MTRDDIIRMAREADIDWHQHWNDDESNRLERFAALVRADERNKLVAWMMAHGYTYDTERDKLNEWMGYTASQGDSTKDLLTELGWQIEQRIKGLMSDMECQVADRVKAEREACAKVADSGRDPRPASDPETYLPGVRTASLLTANSIAAAIRARGTNHG